MAVAVPEPRVVATIRGESVWPLVLTSLAIMGSPGPATISLTAAGSAYGVRRSLGYLLGIIAGTTIVLLAVATGITAALLAVPALQRVLVGVAAVYLLWLAYHIAFAPPLSDQTPRSRAPSLAGGTLLGIANPKAYVAIAAVYASAHLAGGQAEDAVAKVVILVAMIVLINGTWLLIGSSFAPLLRDARRARIVNIGLALALIGATILAVLH
jgi:threonine/homoserine/homoserine lactone efflux protein